MSERPGGAVTDEQVLQQAAEWFARLGDPHANRDSDTPAHSADRAQWQRWLEADPRHAQAWQRVELMRQRFARLPELAERRVALQVLSQRGGPSRRRLLKTAGGLGMVAGAAWLLGHNEGPWPWRADLLTAVGEQQQHRLDDGSQLWLNSNSAVQLDFDSTQRRLKLLKGELLVHTAADPRPLQVHVPEGRLLALGTRFGVYRSQGQCEVSVVEGVVEVCAAAGADPATDTPTACQRVQAGQCLRFGTVGLGTPQALRPLREAWTRGLLVADNMRLADFVAELARHQPGHLGCDPAVAELRLLGSFPLNDLGAIYTALERSLPVRVQRSLPWWRQVQAA